ncbi:MULTISPECIES: aspartate/glutamate racemase family protein [unclassified Kitasatospora]|uniref:aspartate/glutamate racemase family protein n=1 Tax=unclassified Kitasatospora TaxID=2633591 RepID=UPI00343E9F60
MTAPRIALISAVPTAMAPAAEALREGFPEAEVWHLLDDRLLSDADEQGGLTAALRARMHRLIEHAVRGGADAVLLTCSLYGVVAQEAAGGVAVPVLAPDQAAFEQIAAGGLRHVLVVASFEAALRDSVDRLRTVLASSAPAPGVEVSGLVVPEAKAVTAAGERDRLVSVLVEGVSAAIADADAVFLAQYSLAPAARALAAALEMPVVSGPASAASVLRTLLSGP